MCIKLVTRNLFFIFLLLLIGASSFSQLPYTFERLNTESGLPTNTIKGLQFDEKNRFLWIATESGIVRYNGHNVQSFGDEEEKSILNSRVVYFTIANNGTLFGKFVDATSFSIKENDVVIGKKSSTNNNLIEYINSKYELKLNKINTEIYSYNFRTNKFGDNIIAYDNGYLISINKSKLDTLSVFNKNIHEFQLGNSFYLIDEKNNLIEILLNNSSNSTNKILLKKNRSF